MRLYGLDLLPDLMSTVTDAVLETVTEWQGRPLDASYPLVSFAIGVTIGRHSHGWRGGSPRGPADDCRPSPRSPRDGTLRFDGVDRHQRAPEFHARYSTLKRQETS